MRHRIGNIGSYTGLGGNLNPPIMDNRGILTDKMKKALDEAIKIYFKEWNGCDYQITENEIIFGIEPAYQYEDLKVISINREIGLSYLETGRAFSDWGSGIRATRKYYKDYKRNCKFKKFVDKWHEILT